MLLERWGERATDEDLLLDAPLGRVAQLLLDDRGACQARASHPPHVHDARQAGRSAAARSAHGKVSAHHARGGGGVQASLARDGSRHTIDGGLPAVSHSGYRDAAALYERAAARVSPAVQAFSRFPVVRTRAGLTFVANRLRSIERAIPPDPAIVGLIASQSPDLVLVTPLIELGSDQVEYIKAARALGIPCGLCVHSWDNLTNKGLIHAVPERVFVWNEAQRKEAVDLHAIPDANVVVTGAPTYDQWFTRRPSTTREEFCRKVGLPAERPFCSLSLLVEVHRPARSRLHQAVDSGVARRGRSARARCGGARAASSAWRHAGAR